MNAYKGIKSTILAIVAFSFFAAMSCPVNAVLLGEKQFSQMDFYGVYESTGGYYDAITATAWGDFNVTLYPDSDPCDYFLNLMVYSGTSGPQWVIRNMRLPNSMQFYEPMKIARFFDLGAIGIEQGDIVTTIDYGLVVTEEILQEAPDPGVWYTADVNDDHYNPFGEGDANGTIAAPNEVGPPPEPQEVNAVGGPNTPRTGKIYQGVRNVEEEPGGCGPGAVERAWWLLVDNNEITVADMNNVVDEFEKASRWSSARGVTTEGFLRGKAKLNERWGVVTKYQQRSGSIGGPERTVRFHDGLSLYLGGPPSFAFIKQEIDANEVLEIIVRGPNDTTPGHVMTIIGYDEDDGGQRLWMQDDPHQGRDDPDGHRVRNSRFVAGTNGDAPRLPDIPMSSISQVISQSPLEEPPEPNIVHTEGDGNEPAVTSVRWPGYSPVTESAERVWTSPSFSVTAKAGLTYDFWWTAHDLPHPMYKPVSLTNVTDANVVFRWYIPNDPSITDYHSASHRPDPNENASEATAGNTRRESPWALYSLTDLPDIPYRIPTLVTSANDVNLYCAVNLELYMTTNPLGFVGAEPVPAESTLADFGVDINDGQVEGVEGIYYATCPFVLDPNSATGWVPTDPNCWLNSDVFEIQHGSIGVDEGINHYVASDINRDFYVDFRDFARFAARWLDTGCTEPLWCAGADIDQSSGVGLPDVAIVAEQWLVGL